MESSIQECLGLIGHFRVPSGLCFKMRVGAEPLIWKSFFILMQIKLIFTRKGVHNNSELAYSLTWETQPRLSCESIRFFCAQVSRRVKLETGAEKTGCSAGAALLCPVLWLLGGGGGGRGSQFTDALHLDLFNYFYQL